MHHYLRTLLTIVLATLFTLTTSAQSARGGGSSRPTTGQRGTHKPDSANAVPRGLTTWSVDERFGTITPTIPDTLPHLFQNTNFTEGLHGEYNHTGNLGAPRMARIYNGQQDYMMGSQFIFARPYTMALGSVTDCVFTNTKSPITNLTWLSQGNKTNGDDRLRVNFATNINKDAGLGFKVDYLYGRGYYSHQNHSSIAAKIFGSYRGERYNLHAAYILDRTKNAENGGLADENYILHPEYYSTKYAPADMPVRLQNAYNGLKVNTLFLTHRYNIGYYARRDTLGNLHRIHTVTPQPVDTTSTTGPLVADTLQTAAVEVQQTNTADTLLTAAAKAPLSNREEARQDDVADSPRADAIFVPVASIIHTAKLDHNSRGFYDYSSSRNFYIDNHFPDNDSIVDLTRYLALENTLALEMSEGFKRWVKTGMRLYGRHQYTRFSLPDLDHNLQSETFNYITLGAQLMKAQGRLFHYNVLGEIRTTGVDWGEFNVEGNIDFTLPLRNDSIALRVDGFVRNEEPAYYYRHYHGSTAWWDVDLSKVFRTRLQGTLSWRKTRLKVAFETIQNHTFFQEQQLAPDGSDYTLGTARYGISVAQADKNVQLLSAALCQDFKFGPLHWENELTYQQTSDKDVLLLPAFNGWSNLYLNFKIAHVLRTDLGADVRYFSKYYAPAYSPMMGVYAVQDPEHRTKIGNYPWVNAYVNFHLKSCRFYVMFSHINCGSGNYFLAPHYATNKRCLRIGISWNFFN